MSDGGVQIAAVGINEDESSAAALTWVEQHAPDFKIQPVHSWYVPGWAMLPPPPGSSPIDREADLGDYAKAILAERTQGTDPHRLLEPIVTPGRAGRVLVSASHAADLLVVGRRSHDHLSMGSTSSYCGAHATCPCVVVPSGNANKDLGRIVVGFDGSPHAEAALDWAIGFANAGSDVEILHAWIPANSELSDVGIHNSASEAAGVELLDQALTRAESLERASGVTIKTKLVFGDPREVLMKFPSDMMVIGRRGHAGLAHLLVGSVTTSMLRHANQTIAVVPPTLP